MKRWRPWIELALLLAHVGAVILLFRLIEDRRLAATLAGALFLEIGFVVVTLEWIWGRRFESIAFWTAVVFLLVSAIPIMGLRLAYWETPFAQTAVFGVTGPQLHAVSSWVYLSMIVGVFAEFFFNRRVLKT